MGNFAGRGCGGKGCGEDFPKNKTKKAIFIRFFDIFYPEVFIFGRKGAIIIKKFWQTKEERGKGSMRRKLWALAAAACLCASACGGEQDLPQSTPALTEEDGIAALIAGMTPEEKAGQLLMMDFRQNADGSGMTVLSPEAEKSIAAYHIGGVILFAENLDTEEQTRRLTEALQAAADIPLFIGIDEEGGMVSRLDKSRIPHEEIPAAAEMDAQAAEAAGHTIGKELAGLGISLDFAPIADINTNPQNTVIGSRAFSDSPAEAAECAAAFLRGLQAEGVSGCAKHFPGHGDTATDSHNGETYVTHSMERLRETELVPFRAAVEAGADFVMAGHIKTPNATGDGLPASLSGEMASILREEIGFDGILVTDAMNMGAIVDCYGCGESAVMAIQAGVDIVLMPASLPEAAEALAEAIRTGEIPPERVEESLERILSLKYEKGLLKNP